MTYKRIIHVFICLSIYNIEIAIVIIFDIFKSCLHVQVQMRAYIDWSLPNIVNSLKHVLYRSNIFFTQFYIDIQHLILDWYLSVL